MIRLLVANGCSFTRGAELGDPGSTAWPAVLASRLGVPVANLGSDGGSNRRIVRTTVGVLDQVCGEFGVPVEETLVLCMWTCATRGEYHVRRRRDRGNRPDLPYETDWRRLGPWSMEEEGSAANVHFRSMWSKEGGTINLLTDWVLLDTYLRSRGALARYAYAWNVLPSKMPAEAAGLFTQLERTSVYGNTFDSSETSFQNSTRDRFRLGPGLHPLEAAHAYFAARLEEWLRSQELETHWPE